MAAPKDLVVEVAELADALAEPDPPTAQLPGAAFLDLDAELGEAPGRDGRHPLPDGGSGVTAAQTVLALHLAGRPEAALHVGLLSHGITDPTRPVGTGDAA